MKEIFNFKFLVDLYKENQFKCWVLGCTNQQQFSKMFAEDNDFREQVVDFIISKNSYYSFSYAKYILKKPFPKGEPAILMSPRHSYWYARGILKSRWPEAEPIIKSSPVHAAWYALNVLEIPWAEAEPIIATNAEASYVYAVSLLKERFLLGEPIIKNDTYGVKDSYEIIFGVIL